MKRPTIPAMAAAIFAAIMTVSAAHAKIQYIAVVETEVNEQSGAAAKLNRAEVQEITAVLRDEARNTLPPATYKIMTAETIISFGGSKLEECAEENCVVSLGAKIGADYIVRGTLSKFGTELTLSVVMYETEDGTLVASARVSSETPKELLEKTVAASKGMYKTFLNEQAAAQKPPPTQPTYQPPAQTYQQPTPPPPTVPAKQSVNQEAAPTYRQSKTDGSGILTDNRDGKKYRIAAIGGKNWMAENLNVNRGNSWCYNNDNSYCGKYGRLYDWNTAKTACPAGWHLPSRQEWNDLAATADGARKAGKKLKAKDGWNIRGNGTDNFGFSALPGGYRYTDGHFYHAGDFGFWWTATEYSYGNAYGRVMDHDDDNVDEGYDKESSGFSVRCVQD